MTYEDEYGAGVDGEAAGDGLAPPHDPEAEAAVLSAVLLAPERLAGLEALLEPGHFFSGANQRIYEAILDVYRAGTPVDVTTVGAQLRAKKRYTEVGGAAYLHQVLDGSPAVQNVRAHAVTVRERWRQRQLIAVAQRVAATGYGPVTDVQAYCDDAIKAIATLARQSPSAPLERAGEILRRLMVQMRDACNPQNSNATPGIPSGINCLDERTLGWQAGKKWTIVARSGIGKTTFAMQCAVAAAKRGVGVLIFSEMTRDELLTIVLSHVARVDSRRLTMAQARQTLSEDEWQRIERAQPEVERLPLFVDDRGDLDGPGIFDAARRAAEQSVAVDGVPVGMVVVDYIQRLRAPASLPRNHREDQRIRENAKATTAIAKQLGMVVLELAQERPLQGDDSKASRTPKPRGGNVQGCSGVEQESDGVLYLWRPDPKDKGNTVAVITKQRGNQDGVDVPLVFEPQYSTFIDPDYVGFQSAFDLE